MSIRVVIADDHPVVRDGLRLAIERNGKNIVIVGEASDGMEVMEIARTKPVDVFILDITMPKLNGIETARQLLRVVSGAKIIMLSLHDVRAMVEEAMAIGVRGYLKRVRWAKTACGSTSALRLISPARSGKCCNS